MLWWCKGVREKIPNLAWTSFLSRLCMRRPALTWPMLCVSMCVCYHCALCKCEHKPTLALCLRESICTLSLLLSKQGTVVNLWPAISTVQCLFLIGLFPVKLLFVFAIILTLSLPCMPKLLQFQEPISSLSSLQHLREYRGGGVEG